MERALGRATEPRGTQGHRGHISNPKPLPSHPSVKWSCHYSNCRPTKGREHGVGEDEGSRFGGSADPGPIGVTQTQCCGQFFRETAVVSTN